MSTQSSEWIQTARVLRRSGFGVRGTQVDSALKSGSVASCVATLLADDFADDPGVVATPMPELEILDRPAKSDKPGLQRYHAKRSKQRLDLMYWWISRMAAVENPVQEKLTFLWHNHFATSAAKVTVPALMANQNTKIRSLCLGDFTKLAYTMLTDAAMVTWLDGSKNKVGAPNENLAREFLELFALGHGNGYTEKDVREGARALTGWTVNADGNAELVAKRHDESTKIVLQKTGKIGAQEFCDIVVAEPSSERFIAKRLWQQLVSDSPPSQAATERLVKAFGTGRDLRALTAAILTDPEFLSKRGTIVTPPVDWMIGLVRSVDAPLSATTIKSIANWLNSLGQRPFYPPDVGGWPYGQAWLSSAAANIRFRAANRIVKDGDVSSVEEASTHDRIDAAGYLIGVGAWSDRSARALKPMRKDPSALVAAAVNTPEYLTC